jgi:hypothetical protein
MDSLTYSSTHTYPTLHYSKATQNDVRSQQLCLLQSSPRHHGTAFSPTIPYSMLSICDLHRSSHTPSFHCNSLTQERIHSHFHRQSVDETACPTSHNKCQALQWKGHCGQCKLTSCDETIKRLQPMDDEWSGSLNSILSNTF